MLSKTTRLLQFKHLINKSRQTTRSIHVTNHCQKSAYLNYFAESKKWEKIYEIQNRLNFTNNYKGYSSEKSKLFKKLGLFCNDVLNNRQVIYDRDIHIEFLKTCGFFLPNDKRKLINKKLLELEKEFYVQLYTSK